MANYEITTKAGATYQLDLPDAMSETEIMDYFNNRYLPSLEQDTVNRPSLSEPSGDLTQFNAPVEQPSQSTIAQMQAEANPKDTSDFSRGFKTSYEQLPELGYGLEAGAYAIGESAFGEGGMLTQGKQEAVAKMIEAQKETQANAKESDSFTFVYEKAKQGDFNALADTVQYGLGYGLGQMSQAVITGGLGSTVAKTAAETFAKEYTAKLVEQEALKVAEQTAARELTQEQIQQQAVKNVAESIANKGRDYALGAQAVGLEGGEILGDLAKQSTEQNRSLTAGEVTKGLGATALAAAGEFYADRFGLDILGGKRLSEAGKYTEGLKGNLLRGAATGVKGGFVEGGTEFAQTLIEEAGKGKDPFSSESLRQAIDATALGFIGGGAIGTVGGALSPAQQRPDQPATGEIDPSMLSGGLPNSTAQTTAQQPAQTSSKWQDTMGKIRGIVGENQLVDNETIAKDVMGAETIEDAIAVASHATDAIAFDYDMNMEQAATLAQDLTKTDTDYLDNKDYQDAVQLENQLSTVRDQLAYNKFQTAFEESNQQASRSEFNALVEQEISNKNQQLKDLIQYQSDERARKAEVEASIPSINKALEDAQWAKTRNNRNAVIQMVFDRNVPAENIFSAIKAELKRQGFKDTEINQDDIDSYNLLKAYDQNNFTIAKEPVSFGGQPVAARSASDIEFYNTGTNKVDKQGNIIADALGKQGANAGEQFTGAQGQDVVTNFVSPETPVRQESDALRKVDEWVSNGATYKNGMLIDSKGKKFVLNTVQREYYLENRPTPIASAPVDMGEVGNAPRKRYMGVKQQGVNAGEQMTGSIGQDQISGIEEPKTPVTVDLYRGVPKGASTEDTNATVGNSLFMTPTEQIAKDYAGKEGGVSKSTHTFNNLLEAATWAEAKSKIGLTQADTMETLVNTAREQGYDGITFSTKFNGKEYIVLKPNETKAVKTGTIENPILRKNGKAFTSQQGAQTHIRTNPELSKETHTWVKLGDEKYGIVTKDQVVSKATNPAENLRKVTGFENIVSMIGKLGGLSRVEMSERQLDDYKRNTSLFNKNGRTFDDMATVLRVDHGFDEIKTGDDLDTILKDSLRSKKPYYGYEGIDNAMDKIAADKADQDQQEQDELLNTYTNEEINAFLNAKTQAEKDQLIKDIKAEKKRKADQEVDTVVDEMLGKGKTTTMDIFTPERKGKVAVGREVTVEGEQLANSGTKVRELYPNHWFYGNKGAQDKFNDTEIDYEGEYPNLESISLINTDSNIGGFYDQVEKAIYQTTQSDRTTLHELGHAIHHQLLNYRKLTENERAILKEMILGDEQANHPYLASDKELVAEFNLYAHLFPVKAKAYLPELYKELVAGRKEVVIKLGSQESKGLTQALKQANVTIEKGYGEEEEPITNKYKRKEYTEEERASQKKYRLTNFERERSKIDALQEGLGFTLLDESDDFLLYSKYNGSSPHLIQYSLVSKNMSPPIGRMFVFEGSGKLLASKLSYYNTAREIYGKDKATDMMDRVDDKQVLEALDDKIGRGLFFPEDFNVYTLLRRMTSSSLDSIDPLETEEGRTKQIENMLKGKIVPKSNIKFSKAKAQERLAPNGRPSNLNATQYEQVRTSEFKAWFGDWENDPENASKVVDENGEPLVVYHGANYPEFTTFETYGADYTKTEGTGAFFTDSKELANSYIDAEYPSAFPAIYATYLNIKNPNIIDFNGDNWSDHDGMSTDEYVRETRNANENDGSILQNVNDAGMSGYDIEATVYAVFNPNQIKSATGNTGEFSKESNDIRFSKAKVSKSDDAKYLAAVEAGDMETAQEMVNLAAENAGYGMSDYQMSHEAPNRNDYPINDLTTIYPEDIYSSSAVNYYGDGQPSDSEAIAKLQRMRGKKPNAAIMVYRAVPNDVKESMPRNGDWVSTTRAYAEEHGKRWLPNGYRVMEIVTTVGNIFTDGNSIHELGFDDGKEYGYANTKNNRKLIDAVTYDDDANVIPLSKRFNKRSDDVRFSQAQEPTVDNHTEQSLKEGLTQAGDDAYGKGWTDRLLATGMFEIISDADAQAIIEESSGAKFALVGDRSAANTQIDTTMGAYAAVARNLFAKIPNLKNILDYGAGKGRGTASVFRALKNKSIDANVKSYEPFPENWAKSLTEEPDYTNADNIKDGSQDAVVNLNVLNVVPRAIRDDIVKNIGRVLKDGGVGVISSRRWKGDVDTIKPANSRAGEEPNSFYVTRKLKGEIQTNYQKGIEPDELVAYVQELLPNFDVRKINGYGASAVIIQKPNGTPLLDSILKSEKTQSKGTGSESTLELRKEAKDLGAGERYSAFGVGKKMGDEVYLHRDYEDVLPQGDLADAKERIGDFEYNLIRYNAKTGAIGFFNSPDFNTSPEPVNGELMVVEPDGTIRNVPLNKDLDKQAIYHHKWQWVKDDYTGFDVAQSIERSIEWQKVVNREGINRKRIGFQGVWQNEVLKPFDIKYSINGEIEAFFNPADGKTYFVAENIDKATDLHYLMMHEVGVHALNMGGNKEEFESILKQVDNLIKVKNPAALKGRQDALDADTPQEDLREETLAYLLKYAPKLKIVERFKAWLKNALRNMAKSFPAAQRLGFIQWANKLSDQDLLYIANATLRKAPELLLKKSSEYEVAQAQEYFDRTGFMPYLSEGQLEIPVELAKFAIKTAAQAKHGFHANLGLPLNANKTVTLYYPTTNAIARKVMQDRKLIADNPNANRIYLTNQSAGYSVMENRGAITNEMDGAVVLIQIDPSLVQIDDSVPHSDGRRDFFIPIGEGEAFMKKPQMLKLFTLNQPRTKGIAETTTLAEVGERIAKAVEEYKTLTDREKATRYTRAKKILKRYHNITTFLTENTKLEKTRVGDYGLTYEGNSVASQGLGLASAQKINNKNLSTCPVSAICEELCLGETSGQNLLYGGKGEFRSGARLSQYLKTEAMVLHPEEFAIAIAHEIKLYESWAERPFEYVRDPVNTRKLLRDPVTNERVKIDKEIYQAAMRLNVTSDIPPTVFEPIMRAYPNVEFYDYTKLNSDSKLPNLHITYSSTGVSQIVDGVPIFNKHSNWRQSVQRLDTGFNVAMVFSDKNDMPKTVTDEATGKVYQVWNGDNYDARFLDPKRADGIGMIIGLTNKDNTGGAEDATERTKGFFVNYNKKRDGDNVTILDQSKFNARAETYNGEKVTPSIKFSKSKKAKEGEVVNRSTGYTAYDKAKPIPEEVDNKANYPEGVSLEEERDWLMQQLRRFDSFRRLNDKSNELINKYLTTMGRLPELGNYLGMRYQTLGKIDNVDDIVRNVFDTLQKATKEDSKEIYTYLTDNKATTEFIIDPQMALMAKDLKEAITIIGKKLVEFNIIPMESFQMYEGRYLPRVYLEHIIQSSDRYQSLGSGKTLSPMGYAKRRDNNLPEEFRRLIKGEIKNTAYLASRTLSIPLRDIAMMEFFNQISDNEKWVWKQSLINIELDAKTNRPTAIFDDDGVINYKATNSALEGTPKKIIVRKVTPYFLDKEADRILDQSYSAPEEDRKDMQDLAKMMKRAASQAMVNMDAVPADFMKMPNIAKYGSLRGLVVHKLIYDDLVGTINTYGAAGEQTALENFFGNNGVLAKVTSAFKFSHVAINIPTQVTNLLSNGLLLHMSGVRFDKVPVRVTQAFKEVLNEGENYKKMIAMGGRKATFSNQELSGITEWLLENEAEFSDKNTDWFSIVHIMRELSYLTGKTVRGANNLHQNIEMVFKVAKFIDMKAKGANDETAAVMAHQALFDYSFIPRWAKWLRTVPMGIPFITWTIKSFEATLRTAANRPTTFLPYYMLGYAMSLAAGADFGDDGEDKLKAILKLLPERMQRGGSIWILPIRDDAGRTQLIDMKNLFPWGKTAEAIDSLSKLVGNQDVAELRNLADSVGVFSSPITQAVVAIDTNKDAFTGKQIVDENDPPAAKLQSILEYTYGMMSPPMLGGKGDIATLIKSQFPSQYEGIMNKDGSPKKTEQQAFIHLFTGLSIKSVDSEFDRHKKIEAFNSMITGIKAQRTRELRSNPNLSEESRRIVREKYDARIERVKEKKQKFKDETDVLK
jgi:SAM-dependent methyltransferase